MVELVSFFFSCDQRALWIVQSVCPSVRLSVCPSVCLSFHYDPIIVSSWNLQELLPLLPLIEVMSTQKSKDTEVKTPFSHFGTVTPVWIHILHVVKNVFSILMGEAWCGIGEMPYCFSRSSIKFQGHTGKKITDFDPNWAFPGRNSSFNSQMARKWCRKFEVA